MDLKKDPDLNEFLELEGYGVDRINIKVIGSKTKETNAVEKLSNVTNQNKVKSIGEQPAVNVNENEDLDCSCDQEASYVDLRRNGIPNSLSTISQSEHDFSFLYEIVKEEPNEIRTSLNDGVDQYKPYTAKVAASKANTKQLSTSQKPKKKLIGMCFLNSFTFFHRIIIFGNRIF